MTCITNGSVYQRDRWHWVTLGSLEGRKVCAKKKRLLKSVVSTVFVYVFMDKVYTTMFLFRLSRSLQDDTRHRSIEHIKKLIKTLLR